MSPANVLRRRAVALAAAAVASSAAGTAAAAGPWSDPQLVPGGHLARWDPEAGGVIALHTFPGLLAFTPGGRGVAVLGADQSGQGITTFDAATNAFRPLRASSFGGVDARLMATFGRQGVMLAGPADASRDPHSPLNPQTFLDAAVARGSVDGAFTRQVLAHGVVMRAGGRVRSIEPANVTALAANPSGDAAVVVAVPVRGRTSVAGFRSRLFIRRHGQATFRTVGDFGLRTVGRSPAALAVNGPGDVLMAWDDRTSVRAVVVSPSGKVGAEQRLGPGGSAWIGASRMAASIDGTRRMLVAWLAQRVGEGNYAGSPGIVAYAYASPHQRFATARVLQRGLPKGPDRGVGAPGVAATLLRQDAVVAWTGFVGGRFAVRSADVVSGRPATTTDLSPAGSDAALSSMAVGPRGGLVVGWTSSVRPGTEATIPLGDFVRARAAGSTVWGPVETLATTPGNAALPRALSLAADPVSGRAVALWSDPITVTPGPMAAYSSVRANPDAG